MKKLPLFVAMLSAALSFAVMSADDTKPRLVMKADKAREQAQKTEAEQLEKARAAAADTASREADVLKRQQQDGWEDAQRDKAAAQFNDRESREQKYLREAKEAAKKERKIPKP
jgi:predicted cobalt transporter CbtA